jgi:hypothetical protein
VIISVQRARLLRPHVKEHFRVSTPMSLCERILSEGLNVPSRISLEALRAADGTLAAALQFGKVCTGSRSFFQAARNPCVQGRDNVGDDAETPAAHRKGATRLLLFYTPSDPLSARSCSEEIYANSS